jgi:alpha-galactosidase
MNIKNLFLLLFSLVIYTTLNAQKPLLAPVPPMGWNSWNCWGPHIDEVKIKGIADAMVASGMKDAGYQYVVVDDHWQKGREISHIRNSVGVAGRDENGVLLVDLEKFPGGMKALGDYIHSKGLKFGIYTAPGISSCGGRTGSFGHEEQDIQTFVEWGVDFIKLDWCRCEGNPDEVLKLWGDLLEKTDRPIVLSVNIKRGDDYTVHRQYAQMSRTTTDIKRVWSYKPEEFRMQASVLDCIDRQEGLEEYHGNGHWNDPDMLNVGNPPLSYEENKAHFSMWAIFAAPLFAGNDLRNMSKQTIEVLTNKEIINIAQDPAGIKGIKIGEYKPGLEIYVKRLQEVGAQAICFLNRTDAEEKMKVDWKDVGLKGSAFVRNLWEHADKGVFSDSYAATVPAHGVVVLKVSANEYLGNLVDRRIVPQSIPNQGLVMEVEGKNVHWEAGKIESSVEGYSGSGYLMGVKHDLPVFNCTWRINMADEGTFRLFLRYRNLTNEDIVGRISKAGSVILKKC